ncbi:Uncharacterized membrane protein [Cnuella takakiae]|uniref:Uncharacterized membrane protein n=1 Tax=Cnuella takakiae TaxID=1302690 RepID=A0A1M5BZ15_9BACT|nr:DUF1003 domain-containing protein [Cnuella takakiae]OLY93559.1 hypothetical protein BUE76_18025 [Cnuella takakiae]SHF47577.1 Uncharacterized membrane protein [Cnuella takakiae]
MHHPLNKKLNELLETENKQLQQLNGLVLQSVSEEQLLSGKLSGLDDAPATMANRIADKVASFGGSWTFILSFLLFMLVWIGVNLYLLSKPFDPFPFILLNLLLSTIAALQAPLIMMSQNRKEEKDRQRAVNDYMVNLKAEIEVRNLHQKLDLLMAEQMKTLFELQKVQVELMEDIRSDIRRQGRNNH